MAAAPEISVLVPSRNHARYVEQCVRSALSQEGVAVEVLALDDESDDDSAARLSAIEAPGYRFFAHPNRGLSRTLNRGLALARGRWIKFLPSDDFLLPGCLAAQLGAAEGFVATFCRPEVEDGEGRPLADPAPQAWFDLPAGEGAAVARALVARNPLCAPGALFRRDAALAVGGFDPSLRVAQDYDLWLRLAARGSLRVEVERRVVVRWHGANQSARSTEATEAERAYALVGALVRDGLSAWAERFADDPAGREPALMRELLQSGLREVQPFVRQLALDWLEQGRALPDAAWLEGLRGLAPELFRPEAPGRGLEAES